MNKPIKYIVIIVCLAAICGVVYYFCSPRGEASEAPAVEPTAVETAATAASGEASSSSSKDDAVIVYSGKPDLTKTPAKTTVIDFNATWCGPCKQFAPIFHKFAEEHSAEADFYSVDVDLFPELAEHYAISAIPTVVVKYPDGTSKIQIGLLDEAALQELILGH